MDRPDVTDGVAPQVGERKWGCFDGDYAFEVFCQRQREQPAAGVEVEGERSLAVAGDQFDDLIHQKTIGLKKCSRADLILEVAGAVEQSTAAGTGQQNPGRSFGIRGRVRKSKDGHCRNLRQNTAEFFCQDRGVLIVIIFGGLSGMDLNQQPLIFGVGEEFNFADTFPYLDGATELPENFNGTIDERGADGTLLYGKQGMRAKAEISERKFGS